LRLQWPESLRGELDLGDLLELGLFVLFYWLLPVLRRRKGVEEMADEEMTGLQEESPETEIFEEVQEDLPVLSSEPVQRLQEALQQWQITASPRVGAPAASRLVQVVLSHFPDMREDALWGHEDVGAAESITRALDELVALASDRKGPGSRLLMAGTRDLLERPRIAGGIPVILYPVVRRLDGLPERLLNAAGMVALEIPPEGSGARRRLGILEGAVSDHLSRQDRTQDVLIQRTMDELALAASLDPGVGRIARALLMEDDAGEEIFRAVSRAVFIGETDALVPLHLASERSFGWPWSGDLGSAVTLHLAARIPGSPPVDGIGADAIASWERVGAAVARGAGVETHADEELLKHRESIAEWLLRGAVGDPELSTLGPISALIAWRAAERDGAVLHEEELSRLVALVDGTLPRQEVAPPVVIEEHAATPGRARQGSKGGRREIIDAVTLHIVLGAPLSRRHPAFGVGPLPVWRRARR